MPTFFLHLAGTRLLLYLRSLNEYLSAKRQDKKKNEQLMIAASGV